MSADQQNAQAPQGPTPEIPSEVQGKSLVPTSLPPGGKAEPKDEPRSRRRTKEEITKSTETPAMFASDVHKYIREYIQLADQKAAFLFAAVAAMLAYLHGKGVTKLWLKDPRQWGLQDCVAFACVAGLVIGAVAAICSIVPRLQGAARGIFFWKAITLFESAKDYSDEVLTTEPTKLTKAKLDHCFELAMVCRRKYRSVGVALWCGSIGLIASLIYLAVY